MRQIQNGRKNDKYTICNLKPTIILLCASAAAGRGRNAKLIRCIYYIYIGRGALQRETNSANAAININERSSSTV